MDNDALRIVTKAAAALARDAGGDGERFVRHFDPDLDLVTRRGARARGRDAIARLRETVPVAGASRGATPTLPLAEPGRAGEPAAAFEVLGARTLGPGVVVGHLRALAAAGAATATMVTLVLVRQAMDWRIAAYHESAVIDG